MTVLVVLALFFAVVALARRWRVLDDRDGPRDGFPADARRHDWH